MKKTIFKVAAVVLAVSSISFVIIDTEKIPGLDVNNLDRTIKPTDDFNQFVNGNWIKNNPIPATEGSWGIFNELQEKNFNRLKTILLEAAANKSAAPGSNTQKISDFYSLGMDSVKLNKDGIRPVLPEFAAIDKITNTTELIKEVGHLHTIGIPTMFTLFVDQDQKISTQYITSLFQGGLGLPDRDYYTETDERSVGIQKAYVIHLEKMFKLLGDAEEVAKKNAKTVYDIESKLANASMTQIQLRDPEAVYNKKSMQEL
jgi:putative endopeptidase